jgi:hypothetical protein
MLSKTITAVLLGGLTSPLMAQSDATNQNGPMPLFEAVPFPEVSTLYSDEAAVLQRQVRVNLDLLGNDDRTPEGPEAGVLINLFEGVEFVGVFEGFA